MFSKRLLILCCSNIKKGTLYSSQHSFSAEIASALPDHTVSLFFHFSFAVDVILAHSIDVDIIIKKVYTF
jgi:hypothetical protein